VVNTKESISLLSIATGASRYAPNH